MHMSLSSHRRRYYRQHCKNRNHIHHHRLYHSSTAAATHPSLTTSCSSRALRVRLLTTLLSGTRLGVDCRWYSAVSRPVSRSVLYLCGCCVCVGVVAAATAAAFPIHVIVVFVFLCHTRTAVVLPSATRVAVIVAAVVMWFASVMCRRIRLSRSV